MKKIAVMLGFLGSYGRGILRGVMEYANLHEDWEFMRQPMYLPEERWSGWQHADGVVAMLHTPAEVRRFQKRGIPLVNTARTLSAAQLQKLALPTVIPDDAAVGRLAFDYFWERHFRSFAFCGHPTASWSLVRQQAFVQECDQRSVPIVSMSGLDFVSPELIRGLPRPCALFAGNDHLGWQAIDACRESGIAVPEEIAVLGVDNDDMFNNMVRPSLSSIELGAARVGFEAAKMLALVMRGEPLESALIEIAPVGIVSRRSTDVLKIEDPAVAQAAKFIRENATKQIGVDDVLEDVAMSRRNLERRFKRAMHRSLLDEILRVRLDRAATLLRETSLDIERVALQSGFNSHVRFTTVFHAHMNCTPTAYRKDHQLGAAPAKTE